MGQINEVLPAVHVPLDQTSTDTKGIIQAGSYWHELMELVAESRLLPIPASGRLSSAILNTPISVSFPCVYSTGQRLIYLPNPDFNPSNQHLWSGTYLRMVHR